MHPFVFTANSCNAVARGMVRERPVKSDRGPCAHRPSVLYLSGSLLTPLNGFLPRNVRMLLLRGERRIVLDLNAVLRIDASGVGELVRAYNTATAAGSVLQIVGATAWVRHVLELVGLFDILSKGEPSRLPAMA